MPIVNLKKLAPALSLMILASACGKQINDVSATRANQQGTDHSWTEELPGQFRQIISDKTQTIESSQLTRNGWLKLPSELHVRNGSATGRVAHITLNENAFGEYEYRCFYRDLKFEKCLDQVGRTVIPSATYLESDFPVDKGSYITFALIDPANTDLIIEARYNVDWK